MQNFFDRKTFNPIKNATDLKTLNVLRAYGGSRGVPSTAMDWALAAGPKSGVFIDVGCGDSRDWLLAKNKGFIATRTDLWQPCIDHPDIPKHTDFIKADAVEYIPFPNDIADIIVSQAMLDLIEPVAREQFFREVNRVLKPGGVFSCYIQWLQSGWGFDLQEEQDRARKVWPNLQTKSQGFVATKEISNE